MKKTFTIEVDSGVDITADDIKEALVEVFDDMAIFKVYSKKNKDKLTDKTMESVYEQLRKYAQAVPSPPQAQQPASSILSSNAGGLTGALGNWVRPV